MVRKRVMTPSQHEAKKQHILAVAASEFARLGFDQANINTIADLAGVGKGTMYRYFADKEQLFLEILTETARIIQAALEDSLAESERLPATTRMESLFQCIVFLKDKYPNFIALHQSTLYGLDSEFRAPAVQTLRTLTDELEVMFQSSIDAGRMRPIRARSAAVFFTTQLYSFRRISELLGEEGPTPGPFIADLLWRGMKPD